MVITYGSENQYHNASYCPVCNESNNVANLDTINGQPTETDTDCSKCGHKNHWAYGHFMEPFKEVKKKKTPKELTEIQLIYNQMGACVEIDDYGEIKRVGYR